MHKRTNEKFVMYTSLCCNVNFNLLVSAVQHKYGSLRCQKRAGW